VLKTTVAGPTTVDLSPVVVGELRVVGSRCGDMHQAVRTLAASQVDPRPLIQRRFALGQADEALAFAGRRGALKVLIDASGG
jgi:threonine dehydrogenase-like Zn-dependent dehydrogenase